MKYIDIYTYMLENKLKISDHGVLKDVINGMNLVNPNPKLETLLIHIRKRWQDLKGNRICFEKKHKEWLQTEIDVFTDVPVKQDTRGRPSIENYKVQAYQLSTTWAFIE